MKIRSIIRAWIFWRQRRRLHAADPKLAALYAELRQRRHDHRPTKPVMDAMRRATTERLRSELSFGKAAERGASR